MKLKLSATQIIAADDCARLYRYRYIDGVRTISTPANLVFGSAIDEAMRHFFNAMAAGNKPAPPEQEFETLWDKARTSQEIAYPATKSAKAYREMGTAMMKALPAAWAQTGWTVAADKDGAPMTDRFLSADLGTRNGVTVVYRGKIDVAVYTADGDFGVVDVKTAAQPHTALYSERSDQLTGYQLLVNANSKELGVPQVEKLGFYDLIKRKVPTIEEVTVGSREEQDLKEFIQKLFWRAEDIKRKRFPRVSRHAFNSPCNLCDYARLCTYGETDGLEVPAAAA